MSSNKTTLIFSEGIEKMSIKQTFTYKTVEDCAIKADVYRKADGEIQPAIIFIHGGALIGGNRSGIPTLIKMLVHEGYTVVSIDYRLAPETKLKGIIEDLRDAFKWVVKEGPALFRIDPTRIGVIGNSAGGYLTLMSGFVVDPTPKVLVSMYGYGDVSGDWYSKPDPFYCQQPLVDESVARASVGTKTISEIPVPSNRVLFYLYCRQNGLWPKEVIGDKEIEHQSLIKFCPILNVTKEYPPTLLLHGDIDTDVPYSQSVAMAKKLGEFGVEHRLVTISGRGHSFEETGIEDPVVADAFNNIMAFLKSHLF